jgi:hypothetical protein
VGLKERRDQPILETDIQQGLCAWPPDLEGTRAVFQRGLIASLVGAQCPRNRPQSAETKGSKVFLGIDPVDKVDSDFVKFLFIALLHSAGHKSRSKRFAPELSA